jgi:hypothetical protein
VGGYPTAGNKYIVSYQMVTHKQHLKGIVTLLWLFIKRMWAFVYETVFAVRGTAEIM